MIRKRRTTVKRHCAEGMCHKEKLFQAALRPYKSAVEESSLPAVNGALVMFCESTTIVPLPGPLKGAAECSGELVDSKLLRSTPTSKSSPSLLRLCRTRCTILRTFNPQIAATAPIMKNTAAVPAAKGAATAAVLRD
mmetsp:Transcript_59144/g.97890  ORF Transcript_59144/g.97890 Transcript_59144/m.97890 type:complete len:137 (+) Transcript_59144:219-629(+)